MPNAVLKHVALADAVFFYLQKSAGSSYINHFLQPDTIIPDPASPQNLNRYSYVGNRPVNFNDPSGHMMDDGNDGGGHCDLECLEKDSGDGDRSNPNLDKDGDGISDKVDLNWHYKHPEHICNSDSLIECFYEAGYWPAGDTTFSEEDWNAFTAALFVDALHHTQYNFTFEFNGAEGYEPFLPFHTEYYYEMRRIYDTPLWNAKSLTGTICFEGKDACYDRNDVNYVAQGMWSAANHELGHWGAERAANYWKQGEYGHGASAEVLYWVDEGVDLYNHYLDTGDWTKYLP